MGNAVPSSFSSASTPWTHITYASSECNSHVFCRAAGGEEVGPLLQLLSKSVLVLLVGRNLPRVLGAQRHVLSARNLPCLFAKCCFISCLSEAAFRAVKVLKRRRGCRSVVSDVGRGCHWKEPELEEEERWLVVKMSHRV